MVNRKNSFLLRSLFTFALFASFSLSALTSVHAQEPEMGFGVKVELSSDPAITAQGYFIFPNEAGTQASGTLRFSNPTDKAIEVNLTAVDAITANNGGSAFATDDVEIAAIGAWLQIDQPVITLEPGVDQLVDFAVNVPADASPGQYLAGLAAAVALPEVGASTPIAGDANQAGASITMRTRYVIGVEVDVAGEWTPSLVIESVALIEQPSGPVLGIALQNDGATFLRPSGTFELVNADGDVAVQHEIAMGTFVTGTTVTYPVALNRVLDPGTYLARVNLSFGDDMTVQYEEAIDIGIVEVKTITIPSVTIIEVRAAPDQPLQLVNIAVALENEGISIANARLTMHVTLDGELVEDVVLGEGITLQSGAAQISQRYLPLTGWLPGTYAYSVTIEQIDPEAGTATELASAQGETTVVVQ